MPRRPLALIVVLLGAGAAASAQEPSSTARHLLAGVRAFRAGHYDEALVELRFIERAPDRPADLAFYLGPTLFKLGRYDEALVTLRGAPPPLDPLAEFYLGETEYALRLYRQARGRFLGLRARGLGPTLAEAAGRYVAAVEVLYAVRPPATAVDIYAGEGAARLERGEHLLAAAYLEEARQVAELAGVPPPADVEWLLARAYVALGDAERGRPLLARLAAGGGPRAVEAERLLERLSRGEAHR